MFSLVMEGWNSKKHAARELEGNSGQCILKLGFSGQRYILHLPNRVSTKISRNLNYIHTNVHHSMASKNPPTIFVKTQPYIMNRARVQINIKLHFSITSWISNHFKKPNHHEAQHQETYLKHASISKNKEIEILPELKDSCDSDVVWSPMAETVAL